MSRPPIDEAIDLRQKIQAHLIDERLPVKHLRALLRIVWCFNWSEKSEAEVFQFSEKLSDRYFRAHQETAKEDER